MSAPQQGTGKPKKKRHNDSKHPCPPGVCKHPKGEHRPVKASKGWFCYVCMETCER